MLCSSVLCDNPSDSKGSWHHRRENKRLTTLATQKRKTKDSPHCYNPVDLKSPSPGIPSIDPFSIYWLCLPCPRPCGSGESLSSSGRDMIYKKTKEFHIVICSEWNKQKRKLFWGQYIWPGLWMKWRRLIMGSEEEGGAGKWAAEAKLWGRSRAKRNVNSSEDLSGRPQVNTIQHWRERRPGGEKEDTNTREASGSNMFCFTLLQMCWSQTISSLLMIPSLL